jgi:hypothetical protein
MKTPYSSITEQVKAVSEAAPDDDFNAMSSHTGVAAPVAPAELIVGTAKPVIIEAREKGAVKTPVIGVNVT